MGQKQLNTWGFGRLAAGGRNSGSFKAFIMRSANAVAEEADCVNDGNLSLWSAPHQKAQNKTPPGTTDPDICDKGEEWVRPRSNR
eukprot:5416776-Amphidinium_carterae.1